MVVTLPTRRFTDWLNGLKDRRGAAKIAARIVRLQAGNFGDAKALGGKVSELRVDFGPGYRVYFTRKGEAVIILLAGGDKASQVKDIRLARQMAAEIHAVGQDVSRGNHS